MQKPKEKKRKEKYAICSWKFDTGKG